MNDTNYNIFVPCGYYPPYKLHTPIDDEKDIFGFSKDGIFLNRKTLPPYIEDVVFEFDYLKITSVEKRILVTQNFYYLGNNFFIASNTIKEFLQARSGCEFETSRIKIIDPENRKLESYWAMKIITSFDCVAPTESYIYEDILNKKKRSLFSDKKREIKLEADLIPEYANSDLGKYINYPACRVAKVSINFSKIDKKIKIFKPMFWEPMIIIDKAFAFEFKKILTGGYRDYFWLLGFKDLDSQYMQIMCDMR